MEVNKYNIGLSFLRIWMCFEVVICHFKDWNGIQQENMIFPIGILYDFRDIAVPVFMLLAFSLTDMEKIAQNNRQIGRRMYRLLVPQLVWSVVYFVIYCLLDTIYGMDLIKGFSDFWWQLFLGHSINPTTWYQIELILLTVFFTFVFRLAGKHWGIRIVIALGIYALYVQYTGINGTLFNNFVWADSFDSGYVTYPVGRFMEMLPYAVVGILFCHFNLYKYLGLYKKEVIVFSISLMFIFLRCEVFVEPIGYGYSGLNKLALGILMVFLFYYLPFDMLPNILKNIIKEVSKYTLGIYFIHRMTGTIIYSSRLQEHLRMRPGSLYDCIVIFGVSLAIIWVIYKIPFKWIKASMS